MKPHLIWQCYSSVELQLHIQVLQIWGCTLTPEHFQTKQLQQNRFTIVPVFHDRVLDTKPQHLFQQPVPISD